MATLVNIQSAYKLAFADKSDEISNQIGSTADELRDESIVEVVRWYAARMPRLKVNLLPAHTSPYFTVPTEWLENSSRIVFIEFPIDQDPPLYLSPKQNRIVKRETGDFIYIFSNPDGQFRLGFTTKHDDDASTIPDLHEEILGKFAAAVAAVATADFYAHTIVNNVDAVNYRTKEQEWRDLGKNLREQVDRHLRRDEMALRRATDSGAYFRGWAH